MYKAHHLQNRNLYFLGTLVTDWISPQHQNKWAHVWMKKWLVMGQIGNQFRSCPIYRYPTSFVCYCGSWENLKGSSKKLPSLNTNGMLGRVYPVKNTWFCNAFPQRVIRVCLHFSKKLTALILRALVSWLRLVELKIAVWTSRLRLEPGLWYPLPSRGFRAWTPGQPRIATLQYSALEPEPRKPVSADTGQLWPSHRSFIAA